MDIIEKLPYELMISTLQHLDIKTIINIRSVNRKYNNIIMNNINEIIIKHIFDWKYDIKHIDIKYTDPTLCNKYLSVDDNISSLFKYLLHHETSLNDYINFISDHPNIDRECLFLHYLINENEYDHNLINAICLTIRVLLTSENQSKYLTYLLASALYNHNLDLLSILAKLIRKKLTTVDIDFLNNFAFISMDDDIIRFYVKNILNDQIMSIKANIGMISEYFNKNDINYLLTSMTQNLQGLNFTQLIELMIKPYYDEQLGYKLNV